MATTRANDKLADTDDLNLVDRYWRAANYLSVGQSYLLDNPLLQEPLRPEQKQIT
jgi:xylulose-5-phosphate/fructose-6-phosphate phosphoketolase